MLMVKREQIKMKLKMKTTTLIKPLLIAALAIANLHSALVYAAINNNQTNKASKQIYIHALPLSNGEGSQLVVIKKIADHNNILTVNITQLHSLKQLTNLNMLSNVKLILIPNKQDFLPVIVKTAGGNKLFDMATKINDKLQLFIARFKKIFTAKNNLEKNTPDIKIANSNSQCDLNS